MKIAVIMLVGQKFKNSLLPTYLRHHTEVSHDLIIVHRDSLGLPDFRIRDFRNVGTIHLENKIIEGRDIPHRAFGAYRHYFEKYKDDYDLFIFISDDVHIQMPDWLSHLKTTLDIHPKLGWGASQIFNGGTRYPHESHIRAPFWFAKTEALNQISWDFNDDHDGEMKTGHLLSKTDFVGFQIGNKINFAYDSEEPGHISQLLEKYQKKGNFWKSGLAIDFEKAFRDLVENQPEPEIKSPYPHIGKQRIYTDIQPFNGLIYKDSLSLALKNNLAYEIKNGIYKIASL
jgi:hypothetical protein